jgi:hypothetical protein
MYSIFDKIAARFGTVGVVAFLVTFAMVVLVVLTLIILIITTVPYLLFLVIGVPIAYTVYMLYSILKDKNNAV